MITQIYDLFSMIIHNKIAIALSVVLLIMLSGIVWAIVSKFNISYVEMKFTQGINSLKNKYMEQRIAESVKALTKTVHVKLSFMENLEIKYVDKTLLRNICYFANIYVVIFTAIACFLIGFIYIYINIYNGLISFALGISCATLPFIVLDLRAKHLSEKVRKMMATWVSSLNKAADQSDNILYILKYSVETVQEPLKSYIKECIIQLENGLNESEAFDILSMKVESCQFKDFILNLKQNRKYGGNVKKLLTRCEDEFYCLEEEYERRKIKTFHSRVKVYLTMGALVLVTLYLFHVQPATKAYYLTDTIGKWIFVSFIGVFLMGFILLTKITKFDY